MSDKTVIYQDAAGGWRWKRVARNGEIIASSGESFTRLADAERAASRAFMGPDEPDGGRAGGVMYEYRARVLRVVDGDTVWLEVDLGFDVRRRDSFRLYGINAPEMRTAEGPPARQWLTDTIGTDLVVTTEKDRREKYGRYLATLWVGGVNVNRAMIDAGHAVEYLP